MRDETACAGPEEFADTRSQTSSMYSQFSLVRFSSVALTITTGYVSTRSSQDIAHYIYTYIYIYASKSISFSSGEHTDHVVHRVGLRPEHLGNECNKRLLRGKKGEQKVVALSL